MKKFGYARVSTKEQNLSLQVDALLKEGCEKEDIFTEKVSGAKKARPVLERLRDKMRKGDVLIVWKLDRLGRSLKELIELVAYFNEKGIGFKSITDPVDTTSPHGQLIFNIFASLAQFERDVIRERTMAGLEAARARGRVGGRPKGLSQSAKDKAIVAESLYKQLDDEGNKKFSITEICEHIGISRPTLYSYLRHRGIEIGKKN